ncbi:MAG: HEAT repeat domain-containing protein [Nitrospirae bacterium]|nr:HEAT repeat domain-containing protein [Nitrospirota bacterium]
MTARRIVMTAIAALLLSICPAHAAGPWLSLSGGSSTFTSQDRTVFPVDVPAVRASVAIPGEGKRRAEFVWRDPEGRVYSDEFKMLFPDKSRGAAVGWDELAVSGREPSDMPGWWTLDVITPGETLSVRFLLTKNRQEIVLVSGAKEKRLEYLLGLHLDDPESVEAIKLGLTDPDEEVRAMAVRVLRAADAPWGIQLLLAMEDDPAAQVRAAAAGALAGKRGGIAFDALKKASGDGNPAVRRQAASKLPVDGYEPESADLLGVLVRDPDQLIRTIALASLAGMRGEAAAKALKEGFAVDDPSFRRGVLAVVIDRGGPGMYETLVRALDDNEPAIRLAALKALGTDAPSVSDRMALDPDEEVALEAMGSVKGPDGLAGALASQHLSVRNKAVSGLSALPDGEGAPGLALALKDGDEGVRTAALNGLIRAGRAGEAGVAAALDDPLPEIRLTAANALSVSGGKEADTAMTDALGDADPRVRAVALTYLSARGGAGLADVLARFSCDPDPALRKAALGRLARLGGSGETSPALARFYDCGDAETRAMVVAALADGDGAGAAGVLGRALADTDAGIRRRAADALLDMGESAKLSGLALDPDPAMRRLALRAMSDKPSDEMLPELALLIKDEDESVRELAAGVLGGIPGDEAGSLISYLADDRTGAGDKARRLLLGRRDAGSAAGLGVMARTGDDRDRLTALAALAGVPGPASDDALYAAFAAGGQAVRLAALGYLAGRKAGTLEKAATEGVKDPDARVGLTALDAAMSLPGSGRDAVCAEALSSPVLDVRESALLWFKDREGEAAAACLMKGLEDPSGTLRALALGALVARDGVDLAPRLAALLADPEPDVRKLAVRAVSRLKDADEAAGLFAAAVDGPFPDTADDATAALLPYGDPRALPAFKRAFAAGRMRREVLDGMARVPGQGGTDALAYAYGESGDDEPLRLAAAGYLAARGDGALAALETALDDPSGKVRQLVITSSTGLGAEARVRLLGKAMRDPVLDLRKLVADALAGIGTEGSDEALLPALDDIYLRDNALAALIGRGPAALGRIAGRLKDVRDDVYRAALVKALAEAGLVTDRLVEPLDDPAGGVRAEAVLALAGRGGVEAAAGLLYATGDAGPGVGSMAAESLRGRSQEEIAGAAVKLIDDGRARAASLGFATGVLKVSGLLVSVVRKIPRERTDLLAAALGPLLQRRAPDDAAALAEGLKVHEPSMRDNIVKALVSVDGPEASMRLRETYTAYNGLRPAIISAACAYGRIGDVIGMALADEDPSNRRAGAACMGTLSEGGLAGALGMAMKDQDAEVRLSAVRAAAGAGRTDLVAGASGDASPEVRKALAEALGASGRADAAGILGMMARDAGPAAAAAARALEVLGVKVPSKVWATLYTAAGGSKEVRLNALNVLAGRNETGLAGLLASALKDPDRDVRVFAADVLVAKGPEALPSVHPLLYEVGARTEALGVVGRVADPSSDAEILRAMPGMDDADRLAAVDALGRTGGPAAAGELARLYAEGAPVYKKAAVRAMGGLKAGVADERVVTALGDALVSEDPAFRLYAARSAGALKAALLKDALSSRLKVEGSSLVVSAIEEALEAIDPRREPVEPEPAPRP